MDRSKQLGEESVGKLLLKFSIPAITGMLVNALYNIVDRIFVGNGVDPIAIGGLTIAMPIMNIIMAFGMLVGIGTSTMVSIRLGQKNREGAEHILGNALVLAILISLTLTLLGVFFLETLLVKFGATGETLEYAKGYTSIIIYGIVFQNLAFSLNHSIRAEGNPKMAMFTMLIGAILNTILDPIFIYVFKMGVEGAAIATVISQMASAAWVLSYFLRGNSSLKIRRNNLKLNKSIVLSIFSIGVSPFSMQLAASAVTVILNGQLVRFGGKYAVSAMGAINSIAMLVLMPIFGINQGSQPIIGFNYGAEKFDRVKKTLKLAILAATAVSTTGFIAVQLFPRFLVGLFGKDAQVLEIGSTGIRIFLSMLPIIAFQIISANYFQAVGKPKHSMFLSLTRQVIVLIPLLVILPGMFNDLTGVWLAGPSADFISSVITGIFLFVELKHLGRKHEATMV